MRRLLSVAAAPSAGRRRVVDFTDTSAAYASKSLAELVRGVVVLGLCHESVVSRADKLLATSRAVLGDYATDALLRATFFSHFTAGETEQQARDTIAAMKLQGVGGILDFAAEADAPPAPSGNLSRTYQYMSEEACDKHAVEFETCVRAARNGGFAAVKVTALGDPSLLKRCATNIVETRRLFSRIAGEDLRGRNMTREAFRRGYIGFFSGGQLAADKYFDSIIDKSRARGIETPPDEMDLLEWVTSMTPREGANLAKLCVSRGPFSSSTLTEPELDLVDSCLGRLSRLATLAKHEGARIMVDAEQTYFQPAIDSITLDLQRQLNREEAIVFGTYQCYLKDSLERLVFDLNRAQREQWNFACKIVRGAYMIAENKLAQEQSIDSPIQPSLEATANNYLACAQALIRAKAQVVIATHNRQSIELVLREMDACNTPDGLVSFAQLKGMSDDVTFALARAGLPVYKYVPFGPVQAVVPYLVRRAQENAAVARGFKNERNAVAREILRRVGGA